jgi:hypothetical protein
MKNCRAEPDDDATADFAAESLRPGPLPHSAGLNLIDDVGAVDTVGPQINALGGEMPKRRTALFVDCRNVSQVKPHRFSPQKSLNAGGFDRFDSFA